MSKIEFLLDYSNFCVGRLNLPLSLLFDGRYTTQIKTNRIFILFV